MVSAKLIKSALKLAPHDARAKLLRGVSGTYTGRSALSWYKRNSEREYVTPIDPLVDVCLISYPKAGRTWLEMMLGKAFALHAGFDGKYPLSILKDPPEGFGLPKIQEIHEDQPEWKTPSQLSTDKGRFAGKKVIFVARDIRDLVVSNYFHKTRRNHSYTGDLSSFLRERIGSVDTMIAYYKIWHDQRNVPSGFLLVRYEDLHANPCDELRRTLEFVGLDNVQQAHIEQAVEFASFDNMRQIEVRKGQANTSPGAMRPGDLNDTESYKTRKGKVGGFVDYLSDAEIAHLDAKLAQLPSFYGYDRD